MTVPVRLETRNLPAQMEILQPVSPEVNITVRGLRKDASTLAGADVTAVMDLSMARMGRKIFPIRPEQISMPNDRLQVVKIDPAKMEFSFKEKP